MRRALIVVSALGLIAGLSACEKQASQPAKPAVPAAPTTKKTAETKPSDTATAAKPAATPAAPTAALTVDKRMVEAGCGSCMFHMDGVSGCQLAVKIEGKPYLVTGTDVNAHKAGLCEATKQAEVSGQVKDNKFLATAFALKQ